jgi:hypothetical protein
MSTALKNFEKLTADSSATIVAKTEKWLIKRKIARCGSHPLHNTWICSTSRGLIACLRQGVFVRITTRAGCRIWEHDPRQGSEAFSNNPQHRTILFDKVHSFFLVVLPNTHMWTLEGGGIRVMAHEGVEVVLAIERVLSLQPMRNANERTQ